MILYDKIGLKYIANKCRSPRFSYHRGRTWDFEEKTIDYFPTKFNLDTTWGRNYYFYYGNECYRLGLSLCWGDKHFGNKKYGGYTSEVDDFFTKRGQDDSKT